jgi:hypothetical protein
VVDSIAHDKLLAGVRRRVVDGSVLGLIRQWLNAPVVEPPQGVTLYAHLAQLGLVTW